MKVCETYPKLCEKFSDETLESRHLITVDANEWDYDSEDFEYDPNEYNFIVYIADPLKEALGEEGLDVLAARLENDNAFRDFLRSEEDLFALYCESCDEVQLTKRILAYAEEIV